VRLSLLLPVATVKLIKCCAGKKQFNLISPSQSGSQMNKCYGLLLIWGKKSTIPKVKLVRYRSYPEQLTGAIKVKCLSQGHIIRALSAREFQPGTFQLLAQRSNQYLPPTSTSNNHLCFCIGTMTEHNTCCLCVPAYVHACTSVEELVVRLFVATYCMSANVLPDQGIVIHGLPTCRRIGW
jgi:hypothetical protein